MEIWPLYWDGSIFPVQVILYRYFALQWRHNGRDSVSNHQPHDCLLNPLFRRRSKKTSKLRVTGLCARNSSVTGEFSAQMASTSNAENVSIWWRHHGRPHHGNAYDSCRPTETRLKTPNRTENIFLATINFMVTNTLQHNKLSVTDSTEKNNVHMLP